MHGQRALGIKGPVGIVGKQQAPLLVCIKLCACAIAVLHEQWMVMQKTPTSQVTI